MIRKFASPHAITYHPLILSSPNNSRVDFIGSKLSVHRTIVLIAMRQAGRDQSSENSDPNKLGFKRLSAKVPRCSIT